jgi:hypothetical protein
LTQIQPGKIAGLDKIFLKMNFYDIFNTKFAQYKKQNKKALNKIPKNKRTNEAARLFLQEEGEQLKKELDKRTRAGETANFQGLPNAAKTYFGRDFVAKVKRAQRMEGAELLYLGGPNYAFNDGGAIDVVTKMMKGPKYIGPTFVVGEMEETESARAIEHYIKKYPQIVKTISDIYNEFKSIGFFDNSGAYSWTLYGLFNELDEYCLFISVIKEEEEEEDEDGE